MSAMHSQSNEHISWSRLRRIQLYDLGRNRPRLVIHNRLIFLGDIKSLWGRCGCHTCGSCLNSKDNVREGSGKLVEIYSRADYMQEESGETTSPQILRCNTRLFRSPNLRGSMIPPRKRWWGTVQDCGVLLPSRNTTQEPLPNSYETKVVML